MAGASDYSKANILKSLLRGVAMPVQSGTYVSLHTADPGGNGANEVTLAAWPGYLRRNAENGGAIGTGWGLPSAGVSANLLQVAFPSCNSASPVTITHFAIWDALTSGNCLGSGPLGASKTLAVGDVYVADVGALTVTMT